jgi:hypothetical protein
MSSSEACQTGHFSGINISKVLDSVSIALGCGVLGFDSQQGLGIILFTAMSRMALGPTQPPIQWVPGALSLGIKQPGLEADHSPPSSAKVKEWVELYLHSPNMPVWYGAQLKKSTGTFTWTYVQMSMGTAHMCLTSIYLFPAVLNASS